ncbi:MAG: diacylglycerol/lipid kinase family protein [Flavitalea sp.]
MSDASISRIAILANSKAGKGRAEKVLKIVVQLSEGFNYSVYTQNWPSDFSGYSDVFLIGGDGTLNYFINLYPDITLPVTLFKGGSGNDFAWKLYGDISIKEHFKKAINTKPKSVDAGQCNGKIFLNGVGIGFDGAIVKSMGSKRYISAGYIAYLWTVLKHLLFYREEFIQITTDNFTQENQLFMVTVANGSRYGGGFMVSPDSVIDDGKLNIITIKKIAPFKRFFYLPAISKGNHLKEKFASACLGTSVSISSEKMLSAHCDGELLEDSNFEIQILPSKYLFRF